MNTLLVRNRRRIRWMVGIALLALIVHLGIDSRAEPSATPVATPSVVPSAIPSVIPSSVPSPGPSAILELPEPEPELEEDLPARPIKRVESETPRKPEEMRVIWPEDFEAKRETVGEETQVFGLFEGKLSSTEWSLLFEKKIVPIDKEGKFVLTVPIKSDILQFSLDLIGPMGELEKEQLNVIFKGRTSFMRQVKAKPLKRSFFNVGLGVTAFSYSQTFVPDFSELTTTFKASYVHVVFPPNWDVGGSFFINLISLGSSEAGVNARSLGVNLRLGYALPFIKSPWRLSLMTGIYYTSIFVTEDKFGFSHLMGPQIFPVLRWNPIGKKYAGQAYFKYSPIGSGFGIRSLSNRELALGLTGSYALSSGNPISLSLDYSTIHLDVGSVAVDTSSFSVSAGYGF